MYREYWYPAAFTSHCFETMNYEDKLLDEIMSALDEDQLSQPFSLRTRELIPGAEIATPTEANDENDIRTSPIIHGDFADMENLIIGYAKNSGFQTHKSLTKDRGGAIIRGKYLCHKKKKDNCPFGIHFAAQVSPGGTFPILTELQSDAWIILIL